MKRQLLALSRRYQAALKKHLQRGPEHRVSAAHQLGEQAVALGLETLDLARIHKTALAAIAAPADLPTTRKRLVKRAGIFFTDAITPIEKTHRAGRESAAHLDRQNRTLTRRNAQLAVVQRDLKKGIVRRKAAEEALKISEQHYAKLLEESRHLQRHLQKLTHRILSAHENNRKDISRDLRDEIAQTLLGINVRLLTIKKGAAARTKGLAKEIATTQRLVEKSVKTINRFAREFGIHHEA